MLSYRHSYHAGNHADVLKHIVQTLCIDALKEKEKGFLYLDTHSGAGAYSLQSEHAEKTAEYKEGIGRLWGSHDRPAALTSYFSLLEEMNPTGALNHYPGSPYIAHHFLRDQDQLNLTELHPTDFLNLKQLFQGDKRAKVLREDGLQQLKSKLPPKTRRGLILIDPSYEMKEDYEQIPEAIKQGYRRFATGIYLLWYPVVLRQQVDRMLDALLESDIKRIAQIELGVAADNQHKGMTASGMIVINPPWKLKAQMETILPWLQEKMTVDHQGHTFFKTWRDE